MYGFFAKGCNVLFFGFVHVIIMAV